MAKKKATRNTRPRKTKTTKPQAPTPKQLIVRLKSKKPGIKKKKHDTRGKRQRFTKGHPVYSRKGVPNRVPKAVRHSMRAILEEVVNEKRLTIKHAIVDGLNGGPAYAHNYLKLLDDRPSNINLNAHFKDDELQQAQRNLSKKLNALMAKLPAETEPAPEPAPTETDAQS